LGSHIHRSIVIVVATLVVTPPSVEAQELVCDDDGRICTVSSEQAIRDAAADPAVAEIILDGDIWLTEVQEHDDALDIADSTDGSARHLTIRSGHAEGQPPYMLTSAGMPSTLIKCWAHDAPVDLMLLDLHIDGQQVCGGVLSAIGDCSVELDSALVKGFRQQEQAGDEFAPPAALFWGGSPALEVRHSRFEDIEGTALAVSDGQLVVRQSVFTNCRGISGPGGIWIGHGGDVDLRGNLFWGCTTEGAGGGAVAGQGQAALSSRADTFVANRAHAGGAVYWGGGVLSLSGATFAGNATCTPGNCTAATVPTDSVPHGTCNLQWLEDGGTQLEDMVLPAISAGEGEVGRGGAVALDLTQGEMETTDAVKCLFLANHAAEGGAVSVLVEDVADDPLAGDTPGYDQGIDQVRIAHGTFAGNQADLGAALFAQLQSPGILFLGGNLWIDHEGPPIAAGDADSRILLVDNHTDGPPLDEGLESAYSQGDTCGATPVLVPCPAECSLDAQMAFCGQDIPGQWDDATLTTALHFGEALCPADTLDPCESTGQDACDPIDGPCVHAAGSACADGSDPGEGDPSDRGMTGYPCGSGFSISDFDFDGTPDIAECDHLSPGDPPSEDPDRHPFATEICNHLDDNCDGQVDEGLLTEWYADADGDGHAGGEPVLSCDPVDGLFAAATDCDDADPATHPDAAEVHDDGLDNDCDGTVDLDAPGCHSAGCLATRVAPGEDGLELSWMPGLPLGLWIGWRLSRRRRG